jgi:hypothetical protein
MGKEAGTPHQRGSGDTVADIAAKHEFGLGVPRRSFIADWVDESLEAANRRLKKSAALVFREKMPLKQAYGLFGMWAVGEIQRRIKSRIPPPLSPVTIRRKRSSVPLIDTGQLWSSITYLVRVISG